MYNIWVSTDKRNLNVMEDTQKESSLIVQAWDNYNPMCGEDYVLC